MRRPALALLLVALATCGVESTNPLSPPEKAVLDKGLLGTWLSDPKGDDRLTAKISVKDGGVMTIVLAGAEKEKDLVFEGHVSKVGALSMLNLRLYDDGKPGDWMFFRYAVTSGRLEVWELREQVVSKAIEKGELKGSVKTDQYSSTELITDTPEAIAKFIKKQKPDELFKSFATFKKAP